MKGALDAAAVAATDETDFVLDEVIAAMTDSEAARLARCPALRWQTLDDTRQHLRAELLDRARRHRPDHRDGAAQRRGWAKPVLRSIGRDLIRSATRLKRLPPGKVRSLDEPAGPTTHASTIGEFVESSMPEPLERLIAQERRDRLGLVVASLPVHLKLLCGLLQEGSRTRARDRAGLSRRRFEARLEELKSHLVSAGLAPEPADCAQPSPN